MTAVHCGLFRCPRRVLEATEPPWFGCEYSRDRCDHPCRTTAQEYPGRTVWLLDYYATGSYPVGPGR